MILKICLPGCSQISSLNHFNKTTPPTVCRVGPILNAVLDKYSALEGDTVKMVCSDGYELEGSSTVTCTSTGHMSSPFGRSPASVTCLLISVGLSRLLLYHRPAYSNLHFFTPTKPSPGKCRIKQCPAISVTHGYTTSSGGAGRVEVGDLVYMHCWKGYSLVGAWYSYCSPELVPG